MLKTVFLISPVFVSLLWAALLSENQKMYSASRVYLGRFMLLPLIVYFTHFLYHVPLPQVYRYFDPIFAYASLLVFPMYYIYFRLLTIDKSFSLKIHGKYLLPALVVGTLYTIGVFLTPKAEYEVWLYNPNAYNDNPQIQFLAAMRIVGKITYLIQVIATVIGNSLLIKKYGANAEQYYSDIVDGKNNNVKVLNYSIIAISVTSFVLGALGRYLLLNNDWYIYLGWAIFSIVLFIIGYMGFRQKPINPTYESESFELNNQLIDLTNDAKKKLLNKLLVEFEKKKIYLNSQLNIMDIVQVLGTNRTTISNLINQQYNQNFCSFVNSYRIDELERVYAENQHYSNEQLAECCGFGSLNSLKRAVAAKTGMTITEWKNQISENVFKSASKPSKK